MLTPKRIGNGDINLGAIESAITRVEFPGNLVAAESSQGGLQHGLSLVPGLDLAEEALRAGGELQLESEAKLAVHGLEEIENTRYFLVNLYREMVRRQTFRGLRRGHI